MKTRPVLPPCFLQRPTRLVLRLSALFAPAAILLAGCGGVSPMAAHTGLTVTPGIASVDTNCSGCNALSPTGIVVEQFTARLPDGTPAAVTWSVSNAASVTNSASSSASTPAFGSKSSAKSSTVNAAGFITSEGFYTPPGYVTDDSVPVTVTAALVSDPTVTASSTLSITPGFFQPLTPENVAIAPGGSTTITATLAEAGGSAGIRFSLANTEAGLTGGLGLLSTPICQRGNLSVTTCSVVYTAPAMVSAASLTYVIATVTNSSSRATATVLVNPAGITSSPLSHQNQQYGPVLLGSSGGHHYDYETSRNAIVGCCGGTLGALIEDASGSQFILSNNHVLALSDQAMIGDPIVQPALIDNGCSPEGIASIGSLAGFVPLQSAQTNVDAAIARVASGSIDVSGRILELGSRLPDGSLSAAAPGISSTHGRGESVTPAMLPLAVAKSGRTTGLTCSNISAISLDISVEYFKDCAENLPYLHKTFTNQLAISGNGFSDAGDSGAMVVDAGNAEPVGLFFAGGTDSTGVGQGVANPVGDVLSELASQATGTSSASYSFVGTADHPVSCLNFGDSTVAILQSRSLSSAEINRAQAALSKAREIVNPSAGILGVALGKSNDSPGQAAILIYIDEAAFAPLPLPATISGVRTQIISTNARALASGSAPAFVNANSTLALPAPVLNSAIQIKKQLAAYLMRTNPAFFGVGVGQSLDNPREAALIIYVDRHHTPTELQPTYNGLRARYLLMDRMHVTRSYTQPNFTRRTCSANRSASPLSPRDPFADIPGRFPFKLD